MKKIIFASAFLFGFTAIAQIDNTTAQDRNINAQDRLEQLPPQTTQSSVNQAARAADINTQNNQNIISAESKMQSEKERSTGKPDENPALENPKTVRPVRVAEPTSNPGRH